MNRRRRIEAAKNALHTEEMFRIRLAQAFARFQAGIATLTDHALLIKHDRTPQVRALCSAVTVVRALRLRAIPSASDAPFADSLIRQVLSYYPDEALPATIKLTLNGLDAVLSGPPDALGRYDAALVRLAIGFDNGLTLRTILWDDHGAEDFAYVDFVDQDVWLHRVLLPDWTPYLNWSHAVLLAQGCSEAEAASSKVQVPFAALADMIEDGMWDDYRDSGQNRPPGDTPRAIRGPAISTLERTVTGQHDA